MKRYERFLIVSVVGLAIFGLGLALPQRPDLANSVNGYVSIAPGIYANTETTGGAVDLANYGSATLVVIADSIDDGIPGPYAVLQDSLRTPADTAWTVVDSVVVDSAMYSPGGDRYVEIGYQGTGRYLRAILRASGAATDSLAAGVFILRGNCREGPC